MCAITVTVRFAERWAVADLGQTVRVYPNLREPQRYTLYLVRSRQIEQEKRLKRLLGRGRDFESLREYRESDEIRDICWTATARHGKLISKVYQVERSQSVFLVVDAGRLMLARTRPPFDFRPPFRAPRENPLAPPYSSAAREGQPPDFPSSPLTKLDYAVNAALSLAHVALHSGDTTGLLAYGRKLQSYLPAARGAAHLRQIVDQLAQVSGESVEAHHALAADSLLTRHRRRSLVVWITDLAETAATPDVIEAASRLLPQHVVLFVVVGEPEMRALVGRRPQSPTQMYQYVAAQEILQRREILLRRLREQGALADGIHARPPLLRNRQSLLADQIARIALRGLSQKAFPSMPQFGQPRDRRGETQAPANSPRGRRYSLPRSARRRGAC